MLGIGYGLPLPAASVGLWQGEVAKEVLNPYALTAFAGWAHFIYAWRGQWSALARLKAGWAGGYWLLMVGVLGLLVILRNMLGIALFSALAWVWFVGHLVKAEVVFAGKPANVVLPKSIIARSSSYQPVVAFAWLSLVLFNVADIQQHRWLLFVGSLSLGACMLALGGWHQLAQGEHKLLVVALFFIGESMVWGTYGAYMTPAFRIGVYVFHVAGASFYHYLGSYADGRERTGDRWLGIVPILAVNLGVMTLGWSLAAGWLPEKLKLAMTPILGVGWFTLWVALHLAASDILPVWKRIARMNA